ncbi:PREDICTED: E3 ubiquitin-protein ligase makorin-like isoform X2 [Nicotiana attenuata]|uniref:E3 ubiquitin-protein ligase makorin-like isoform X2 n=1 Tax=Nicotiana attenuata TaxID=49451 RepID=UPI0009053861|nr:PREDICTED: E3 ubiquitin-protein ligase makorin-like isoform X2 [Nicotiana attenuata]
MSKRVLCKFFVHGACLKGEYCEFSHDWKDPPNNVCTYYQKGLCAYGSRCRYEHVKVSQPHSSPSSSAPAQHLLSDPSPTTLSPGMLADGAGLSAEYLTSGRPFYPPNQAARSENSEHHHVEEIENFVELKRINPANQSICSLAAAGNCPRGEKCTYIHGDLCPICAKHCLHPFRPQEREEHMKTCEKRQKHLDLLKHSQEIECCVCLERVLSKTTAAERKFGILSECDHPFCISCIRNWRSGSPSSGIDINSTFRTCPVCRKLSYFVIPSVIWYSTKEEKQDILDSYKAKLRSIDCKHFDFGNGTCPFGASCFYKHQYRDGRLEEVVLRHLGSEDGSTVVAKNIRLSDFLSNLRIR